MIIKGTLFLSSVLLLGIVSTFESNDEFYETLGDDISDNEILDELDEESENQMEHLGSFGEWFKGKHHAHWD